jgi:hypothetical protein
MFVLARAIIAREEPLTGLDLHDATKSLPPRRDAGLRGGYGMKRRLVNQIAGGIVASTLLSFGLLIDVAPFSTHLPVEAGGLAGGGREGYPPDMPDTPFPEFKGCSAAQEAVLKKAWRHAHYYTWRADKLLDHMFSQPETQRDELWNRDYVDGDKTAPSPRTWFGPYNGGRANKVREAIDKARRRFENRGDVVKGIKTLRCGQPIVPKADQHTDLCPGSNIGGNGPPGGYHAPVGTIVTCPPFWDTVGNNFISPEARLNLSARCLVHEIFHWLSVDAKYVTDFHGGLLEKDKYYGVSKSLYLAEHKPDWAIYNNDNYAWFIYYVGGYEPSYSAVWGGKDPGGTGAFFVDLSWEELTSWWNKLAANQYLNDVETYVKGGERRYIAVWRVGKGNGALWASEWIEFSRKWNELRKTQDLIDVEVYRSGDRWIYLGVYRVKQAGVNGDGGLLAGLSWEELVDWREKLAKESYLADVETYVEGGKRKFVAVWRVGKGTGGLYWQNNWPDFGDTLNKLRPTQQLIDFEKFLSSDGKWNYLGVWRAGKPTGPFLTGVPLTRLFSEWDKRKTTDTLLSVEEYSALPARIK